MAHSLALRLRNLQSLVELGVDENSTVGVPAPLMATIAELGAFLAREKAAGLPAVTPAHAQRRPATCRHHGHGPAHLRDLRRDAAYRDVRRQDRQRPFTRA